MATVTPTGPISLYNFDDDVLDSSGNANHGTVTGNTTFTAGINASAFDFDGSTLITLANEGNFDFDRTDSYSFATWINPDVTGIQNLFDKRTGTDGGYVFWLDGNKPAFFTSSDSGNRLSVRATTALSTGTWQHVAITYDGSSAAGGVTMYVDGSPVATTTTTDTLSSGNTLNDAAPKVGAKFNSSRFLDGQMDILEIYNSELSADKVSELAT